MKKFIKTITISSTIGGVISSALLQNWLAVVWSVLCTLAVLGWDTRDDF